MIESVSSRLQRNKYHLVTSKYNRKNMENSLMYAILFTDGQIDMKAIRKECRPEKWVPILTYKDVKNITIVPVFYDANLAKTFIKRNFPKDWTQASVSLGENNLKWMKDKGWKLEVMTFPRLMKNLPNIHFEFEILDLLVVPEIKIH